MNLELDLEKIATQERELQLQRFDAEVAWKLGERLRELAIARQAAIVIDVRRFGQPLFYSALPGTSPDNYAWVRRKINVVARFHRSSYAVGLDLQRQNKTLLEKYGLSLRHYAAHGGCFPLTVSGAGIVGCVTVSGIPQRADHELVVEALCLETGRDYETLALPNAV